MATDGAINQLEDLMEEINDPLQKTFANMHQGYPKVTMIRFLKAREWNVSKAHKMLMDCLNWRIVNDIDNVLSNPILPTDLYKVIRDTQLVGLSGYTRSGIPVFAIGIGKSFYSKASVENYLQSHIQLNEYRDRVVLPFATRKKGYRAGSCVKVLDMSGLKITQLGQLKLLSRIAGVDDLNYPEKTETYYVVNAPSIFSSCWKMVKPLLQERTKRKVEVLQGCGKDELLKVMDYESLPHFCRGDDSEDSQSSINGNGNCYSFYHEFHQQMYNYIKNGDQRSDRERC